MSTIYLGIGSNVGDKKENLEKAIALLNGTCGLKITAVSSFYPTKPVGGPKQADYFNGAVKAETTLSPAECLAIAKRIEKKLGRKKAPPDHPRVIDIDILLYGNTVHVSDEIVIPHVKMHERRFVLKGLSELAPGLAHPVLGRTIGELYREQNIRVSSLALLAGIISPFGA